MNKKFPNQKWSLELPLADKAKELLIKNNGIEDKAIKSKHESWRIKVLDATFTYYKTGTLFSTGTTKKKVQNIWQQINKLSGGRYHAPTKHYLIGLDETGKGEVLGPAILVGAFFPKKIFPDLEKLIGVADSKSKRTVKYWDEVQQKLDNFKKDGFTFIIDKIPPEHIDRFNINKIMDVIYQRILSQLVRQVDISRIRIAVDDYRVGEILNKYLSYLENARAEVIVAQKADEKYLETKVASLIARREREKVMDAIAKSAEYQLKDCPIGSGNAGDEKTIKWLKAWKATGKPWPWFVKQSFKTVRDIDGKTEKVVKKDPPIREDILCDDFRNECQTGSFSITKLSVVCPHFGSIRKTSLITIGEGITYGCCPYCKNPIFELKHTLRYYCGSLLPDTNIILNGWLSKDLEHAKFFEGFNILIHPLVKWECSSPECKRELARLAEYDGKGLIKMLDLEAESLAKMSIVLDKSEQFRETVHKFNAIIMSSDEKIIASAQENNFYCLIVRESIGKENEDSGSFSPDIFSI